MVKPRVGLQIKEALNIRTSQNKNADLTLLSQQFQRLKTKLRHLIEALRAQHLSLLRLNETRTLVAKRVAALAIQSPLSELSGSEPGQHVAVDESDLSSYVSVHQAASKRQQMYADRYLKFLVEYAIEWEKVIISRVSTSLMKAEELRRNLDHYQSKVEQLRFECNRVLSKGKNVEAKLSDRLKRNEEKLLSARNEYEIFSKNLSILMEEVSLRCWKDLHPILLKLTQFDATLASDENKILSSLNQISESLKQVAYQHGLKPQSRFKEIESLSSDMFTRKEEAPQLMIEQAPNSLALTMSNNQSSNNFARDSSPMALNVGPNQSNASPEPTTSQMLTIAANAAPPPTMEMVNECFADASVNGSERNNDPCCDPFESLNTFSNNGSKSPIRPANPGTNPFRVPPTNSTTPFGSQSNSTNPFG